MTRINLADTKSDRALALKEKGLESWQIAERMGCSIHDVSVLVKSALKKRERLASKAAQ